jgi:hypothetical protein
MEITQNNISNEQNIKATKTTPAQKKAVSKWMKEHPEKACEYARNLYNKRFKKILYTDKNYQNGLGVIK